MAAAAAKAMMDSNDSLPVLRLSGQLADVAVSPPPSSPAPLAQPQALAASPSPAVSIRINSPGAPGPLLEISVGPQQSSPPVEPPLASLSPALIAGSPGPSTGLGSGGGNSTPATSSSGVEMASPTLASPTSAAAGAATGASPAHGAPSADRSPRPLPSLERDLPPRHETAAPEPAAPTSAGVQGQGQVRASGSIVSSLSR